MPAYFSKEFTKFLRQLSQNNNREWFNKNKERYEQHVKEPFENFIGEMILRVSGKDPRVKMEPKDAIFRIYRDMRFSRDKTPYKTHMSAVISPGGRRQHEGAFGMYLQLSPKGVGIYGGVHMAKPKDVEKIRKSITNQPAQFKKMTDERKFKTKFGHIQGEKYKRVPKEYEEAAKKQPLLANKTFYYSANLPAAKITSTDLPAEIMQYYQAMQPLNKFFEKALTKKLG